MKSEVAAEAGRLLDSATDRLLQIVDIVKTEVPLEHEGYIALVAPALEGVFSMAAVIWRAQPALAPADGATDAAAPDEPSDDQYRWANAMPYATAARIVQIVESVSALVAKASAVLHAGCTEDERTNLEEARRRAEEGIETISQRLTSQHPNLRVRLQR